MTPKSHQEKRLVLFRNRWLEKLTVISVRSFVAVWAILLPLIAVAGWGTVSFDSGIGLVVVGIVIWSLFEYVAHRHLFHWETNGVLGQKLVYVIHGNHHAQPRDHLRNLMPPIVSIPVGIVVWAFLFAIVQDAGTWVFLGFMIGYVAYDLTHYACHQWRLRGPIGTALKRHHMRHHFSCEEGNYAITGLFWDRVFGTRLDSIKRRRPSEDVPEELLHPAE